MTTKEKLDIQFLTRFRNGKRQRYSPRFDFASAFVMSILSKWVCITCSVSLDFDKTNKWFEGRRACHLCGARLRRLLPHKCRIPPRSVPPPPVRKCPKKFVILDGPNRQWPIASVQRTRSTLAGHSSAPRRTNVTRMNANRTIRIGAQRTQGL